MADPGRRRKSPPFVMIYHKWMETPAWHALTGNETKLLLELLRLYRGDNNGKIGMGCREAEKVLGCSRNTAVRTFRGLRDKGWIRPARTSNFDTKHIQTEWRLTMWPAFGKIASHSYRKWKPEEN